MFDFNEKQFVEIHKTQLFTMASLKNHTSSCVFSCILIFSICHLQSSIWKTIDNLCNCNKNTIVLVNFSLVMSVDGEIKHVWGGQKLTLKFTSTKKRAQWALKSWPKPIPLPLKLTYVPHNIQEFLVYFHRSISSWYFEFQQISPARDFIHFTFIFF